MPGDIVRVQLGVIIPADIKLIDGDYLSVDQSALTGGSLPVNKKVGDLAYSSSVAKQAAMQGLVVATRMSTSFGEPAELVREAEQVRLDSTEEMAGMDVPCLDKTGTLTSFTGFIPSPEC